MLQYHTNISVFKFAIVLLASFSFTLSGCVINERGLPDEIIVDEDWIPYHLKQSESRLGYIVYKNQSTDLRWSELGGSSLCLGDLDGKVRKSALGNAEYLKSSSKYFGIGAKTYAALVGNNTLSDALEGVSIGADTIKDVSIRFVGKKRRSYFLADIINAFAEADDECLRQIQDFGEELYVIYDEGIANRMEFTFITRGEAALQLSPIDAEEEVDAPEPNPNPESDDEFVLEDNCSERMKTVFSIVGVRACNVSGDKITLVEAAYGYKAFRINSILNGDRPPEVYSPYTPADIEKLRDLTI